MEISRLSFRFISCESEKENRQQGLEKSSLRCAVKMLNLVSFVQICHSCETCLFLVPVYRQLTIRDKVGRGILHENKGSLFLSSGFYLLQGKKADACL
jgi:hypothetical protein